MKAIPTRWLICAALALIPVEAAAQPKIDNMPGVSAVVKDLRPTSVGTGLYYSQLRITTSEFSLPNDEKARKKIGRALLEALKIRKETRSIIVSVTVSTTTTTTITFPEYPVLSYQFDGNSKLVQVSRAGSITLPLQRLEGANQLRVGLVYRYSNNVAFDAQAASQSIQDVIPGTTVASLVTQPFISRIALLAGTVLSATSSTNFSSSVAEEMRPSGSPYPASIAVQLVTPDRAVFGTVNMELLVTPTLQRPSKPAITAVGMSDLKLLDGEGSTLLVLGIGGVDRSVVAEIKGLKEFASLASKKDATVARDFCIASRNHLANNLRLTLLDRVLAMHQALVDADAALARGGWYSECFDAQETAALSIASSSLAPPPATVKADPSVALPEGFKDALGCHLTSFAGSYCGGNAPDSRAVLRAAFANQVRVGQLDFTTLMDIAKIDPATRLVGRDELIDAMSGKASSFCCYSKGFLVGADQDQRAFRFSFYSKEGLITGLDVVAIPVKELKK